MRAASCHHVTLDQVFIMSLTYEHNSVSNNMSNNELHQGKMCKYFHQGLQGSLGIRCKPNPSRNVMWARGAGVPAIQYIYTKHQARCRSYDQMQNIR